MEKWYDESYFFSERHGGKRWTDAEGKPHEFGYTHGGLWNFDGIIRKLIELLGTPESVLDIGAGTGGLVATLNDRFFIPALGLEFSGYAIDNAVMGAGKYLKRWDLEDIPWEVYGNSVADGLCIFDWVTAIDLFEHLFADKVDSVVAETKRRARRWIVAKICTAQLPHEVWCARRGTYEEVLAQAKAEGYEWLVVSGHVNSQFPQYWREKFQDDEWRLRDDLAERLKKELCLPDDWRCTLILESTKWFEREFGR
jgi:SAM-dependent methyltransferase